MLLFEARNSPLEAISSLLLVFTLLILAMLRFLFHRSMTIVSLFSFLCLYFLQEN
jgi:hypothetical protein